MSTPLTNRHDILLLFEVTNGNPNAGARGDHAITSDDFRHSVNEAVGQIFP